MWTTRVRHEKPVLVGAEPALTLLRVYGERRTAQHSDLDALAQNSMDLAEKRYINGEALTPPHEPQMYGGEAITGSPTTAGIDRPDAVSLNTALANPTASFQWVEVRESTTALDPEQERVRWNQGKHLDDQTQKMQQTVVQGNPMLGTPDQYTLTREETANEIRARMTVDQNEWDNNSYHSAILRSPENHRWVTAMDIAIGQARCLDDPQMREVLTAIADWKMTKVGFKALTEMPSWSKLSAEAQALVKSNYLYYDEGTFPSDLVPMTPPPLAFVMSKQGEAS
jgi:hypothetical protein